jgi:hypothetical protein
MKLRFLASSLSARLAGWLMTFLDEVCLIVRRGGNSLEMGAKLVLLHIILDFRSQVVHEDLLKELTDQWGRLLSEALVMMTS